MSSSASSGYDARRETIRLMESKAVISVGICVVVVSVCVVVVSAAAVEESF